MPERHTGKETSAVSRRTFLLAAGAGGLVLSASGVLRADTAELDRVRELAASRLTRQLHLRRREDLLNLRFEFYNADVVANEIRAVQSGPSYLVVKFPPQSVLEETLTAPPAAAGLPLATRVSGESRLAFDITDALPLPCTAAALLSWTGLAPKVVPTATTVPTANGLVAPADTDTALEMPWHVQLSPDETGRWEHTTQPVTRNGWTELWHTRLGTDENTAVRAVWLTDPEMPNWVQNPGSVPSANTDGLNHVLPAKERFSIVRLSADPALDRTALDVQRLMLSSLGGWLHASGTWNPPANAGTSLTSWQHRATQGRDHFVRTVEKGFLFPYGHRAAKITVAERRFARRRNADNSLGPWYAYMHQREYIVVQQPVRTYAGDAITAQQQRKLPFTRIRVVTVATPDLDLLGRRDFVTSQTSPVNSFVPKVNNQAFAFQFRGTDWAGDEISFTSPAVFVPYDSVQNHIGAISNHFNTAGTAEVDAVRGADAGGRKIAMAPAAPHPPGSTTAVADRMVFASTLVTGPVAAQLLAAGKAPFHPNLERANLRLPEVAALIGGESQSSPFEYPGVYLDNGFNAAANSGAVFLVPHSSVPAKPPLDFATGSTGGMATPSGSLKALSAKTGPVTSSPLNAAKELYDPAEMFGDAMKSKLLGGIPLKDVLPPMPAGPNDKNAGQAVKISYRHVPDPDRHQVLLDWQPKVQPSPYDVFVPKNPDKALTMRAVSTLPVNGVPGAYEVYGELRDFALNMFGTGSGRFIKIDVGHLRFSSASGAKTTVDCKVAGVEFFGPLSFVEKLAKLCKLNGLKFEIVVGGAGIRAALRFAVPAVSVGVFSLKNITLGAGVTIPFDGSSVRVNFDLSTREDPFQLTISFFSGGGYAGIALGADGVERLEIGFVFGAAMELNMGVASGGVEAMGGISYLLEKVEAEENGKTVVRQQAALTAFLRLRGRLSIIGLVHLSLEFYLGLTYLSKPDGSSALVGEASMTVSVDVLFFSTSVTFKVRRELSATAPPQGASRARAELTAAPVVPANPFGAAYTQQDWTDYCAAFAPVGA